MSVVFSGSAWGGTPASTANDICASNANPCNVASIFDIVANSTLDFGTRAVNVSGAGQFNFAGGSGSILCGPFTASTSGAAIDANGAATGGGTESGSVGLRARRTCSVGTVKPPCVDLSDCQLGTCGVRRCSLNPARVCTTGLDCQLGTCAANRRCSGAASLRCSTNSDCDFGTCPAQLTCSGRSVNPLNCAANADCDFGTCSVGTASITMGGSMVGNSNYPASIVLRAADNITISKTVNVSSTLSDSDGGTLSLDAAAGSVTVTAKISATGGGTSQGGDVEILAATDVTLGEEISVVGGDFDGGGLDVIAGRDVIVNRSVLANSSSGAGFGGEILLEAGRDLTINGVGSSSKTTLETNGHTDAQNFAGDGGLQDLSAGRNLSLTTFARMLGTGSQPDGLGSEMYLTSIGNLVIDGSLSARSTGTLGGGGSLEVVSGGTLKLGSTGSLEVTGAAGGGGYVDFDSAGNADFLGIADVSGVGGGSGGSIFADIGANTAVSGTLLVAGTDGGSLEVEACRITLAATGKLDNKATKGDNTLLARESMKLLAGSAMTVPAGGTNTLIYRAAAKPPVTSGTISPAPIKVVDGTLVGCPVCGNSEVDQGETCDDGNLLSGDGCSSLCQNEKCLAQTVAPGYPAVALCEDGNLCTADVCNTTLNGGTCQHPAKNCDDSIACTADSCNPATGGCDRVPNNNLCNDSNPCTDDFCSLQSGCSGVSNSNPCNDGDACTQNDVCAGSMCHGTPINNCGACGDGTTTPPEQCDDGNATFVFGEYCGVGCLLIPCGKPTNSAGTLPKSSDALFTLRSAVGQSLCSLRVCDVDSNGKILASDSLRILKAAVGQSISLTCPAS